MLTTYRRATPGTAVGEFFSAIPSISSRFDAASVLTNSTDLPASVSARAVAASARSCRRRPCP